MNRARPGGAGPGLRDADPAAARQALVSALRRYIEQELMLPAAGARSGSVPRARQADVAPRVAPGADPVTAGAPKPAVSGGGQSFLPVAAGAAEGDTALIGTRVIPLPGEASRSQVESLQEVAAACAACTACPLSGTRHNTVPGAGHAAARLVIVGEGPGDNEDQQGLPFVGAAGKLLTKMLAAIHLTRDEVFITNIVKCRPPENRVPHEDEVAACRRYLEQQIAIIRPALIVSLGAPSTKFFLETPEVKITKIRGQLFQWRGVPLIPTLHPAYLLRASSAKKDAWEDLKKIRDFLAGSSSPAAT